MSVRAIPDRIPEIDPMRLHEKWGSVLEQIASDPALVEAVRDVLLHEHYKKPVEPRPGRPDDYAHVCHADGWQQGLAAAFDALTNREYIREQRILIETMSKEPTHDDRA